jgi:hypothetical protein
VANAPWPRRSDVATEAARVSVVRFDWTRTDVAAGGARIGVVRRLTGTRGGDMAALVVAAVGAASGSLGRVGTRTGRMLLAPASPALPCPGGGLAPPRSIRFSRPRGRNIALRRAAAPAEIADPLVVLVVLIVGTGGRTGLGLPARRLLHVIPWPAAARRAVLPPAARSGSYVAALLFVLPRRRIRLASYPFVLEADTVRARLGRVVPRLAEAAGVRRPRIVAAGVPPPQILIPLRPSGAHEIGTPDAGAEFLAVPRSLHHAAGSAVTAT